MKARESLEKILANLKTTNVQLEEKLQSETITRAHHERDAEEHKDLWNSEVKSRSRLGLKVNTVSLCFNHCNTLENDYGIVHNGLYYFHIGVILQNLIFLEIITAYYHNSQI